MRRILLVLLLLLCLTPPVRALEPADLALVVNSADPEGLQLATLYAKARGVPEGRVIELTLPRAEQIAFDVYEREVVPPVRAFLRGNGLEKQVKCLVTFRGMPLKVEARKNTPDEDAEMNRLRQELTLLLKEASPRVGRVEKLAGEVAPGFKPYAVPPQMRPLEGLSRRLDLATRHLTIAVQRTADPAQRQALTGRVMEALKQLNEMPPLSAAKAVGRASTGTTNAGTQPGAKPATGLSGAGQDEPEPDSPLLLRERRFSPTARAKLRDLARRQGLVPYMQVIEGQADYLTAKDTDASLDSELALLWWPSYARQQWQLNPLCHRFGEVRSALNAPPVVMVSRIDAPTMALARSLIEQSVQVERQGLKGKVVIDARGIQPLKADRSPDGYGQYDQTLRALAVLLQTRTKLPLVFDDKPDVLAPDTVKGAAVYCGWYSVRKYVPACDFVPGAVGYHIASYELTTLRNESTEWVRGLMTDGVVATLGPVSEPFLHSFPPADEFVPLLLTGKLTLAEVYWKTAPLASWKMVLIGDPLYNPFVAAPALEPGELPEVLRDLVP